MLLLTFKHAMRGNFCCLMSRDEESRLNPVASLGVVHVVLWSGCVCELVCDFPLYCTVILFCFFFFFLVVFVFLAVFYPASSDPVVLEKSRCFYGFALGKG